MFDLDIVRILCGYVQIRETKSDRSESDNFSTGSGRGYLSPTRLDRARLICNIAFLQTLVQL
jgi:hypothetical protein